MKSKILIVISVASLLFLGCSKDDTPAPAPDSREEPKQEEPNESESEIYFSYKHTDNSFPEDWIVIHDASGNLLDYKQIDDIPLVDFSTSKNNVPKEIAVTLFSARITEDGTNPTYKINTYANIKTGSIWDKTVDIYEYQPPIIGNFKLTVNNIPGNYIAGATRINVGTSKGFIFEQPHFTAQGDGKTSVNLESVPIHENEDYLISIYDQENNHKYIRLRSPLDEGKIVLDYADFNEYDSYLKFLLPEHKNYFLTTIAYSEESPNYFYKSNFLSWTIRSTWDNHAIAGYVDDYTKFHTLFNVYLDDYGYSYSKSGDKVESINIPQKPAFKIIKDQISDFEFESDKPYIRKTAQWLYRTFETDPRYTEWNVNSSGGSTHVLGNLPQEIVEKYPTLGLDKIELNEVKLYSNGYSYDEFINIIHSTYDEQDEMVTEYFNFRDFD
ncbi:hypothetical protein [Ulvibacterium marinum]|uniref:hypothetical protein n=1 Tax=Ulvibacterium marinum TaxID=2419782 RepID=UPI0024950120|nr:hypothetical protein [Ulvibacterium marinum]